MSAPSDSAPSPRKNPLIWIAVAVALVILFFVVGGERGQTRIESTPEDPTETAGTIERSLLVPPGMRARQYIEQLRAEGTPLPLQEIH